MKEGLVASIVVLAGAAAGIGGYSRYGRATALPGMTTVAVSHGDIAATVDGT